MKTLINNQGNAVRVSETMYNQLANDFSRGTWMCMIRADSGIHTIILPDNFEM